MEKLQKISFGSLDWKQGASLGEQIAALSEVLPREFTKRYRAKFRAGQILQIKTCGFTYLFDFDDQRKDGDDRVVAVWGLSQPASGPRDSSRMKGFLGGGLIINDLRYDKGHAVSHGQGGFEDGLNLFPQRPDINRGLKCADPRYRQMERNCAANPGTFFFSRMIYGDRTWVPHAIEYGILRSAGKLDVVEFPN